MMAWGSAVQMKGFGLSLVSARYRFDGSLEIDDAFEDAAFEPLPGQLGEETFNGIEPGGRGRSEVEVEPRMPLEPGAHLWMLMRGVVVDDQMQFPRCRRLAVDLVQEADELLVPVARHALADDLPLEHVERGKQRCRAVTLVVVCHRPAAAALHRQSRLGAVECLDLRLLVNREHQRVLGWIDIKANN